MWDETQMPEDDGKKKTSSSIYMTDDEREIFRRHSVYGEPLSRAVVRLALERCKELDDMEKQLLLDKNIEKIPQGF